MTMPIALGPTVPGSPEAPIGFMVVPEEDVPDVAAFLLPEGSTYLLCDPLTGLVSYPCFEAYMVRNLAQLLASGNLHLAIGDVDDLRGHVAKQSSTDPTSFGHLAGNECMRTVGLVTRAWARGSVGDWSFSLCATFGGDEVIVVRSGGTSEEFRAAIDDLAQCLRDRAPRPCSFAIGSASIEIDPADAREAYRRLVSTIDRVLFDVKDELRAGGIAPHGHVFDAGTIDLTTLRPDPEDLEP